jgi:hypothetical protein
LKVAEQLAPQLIWLALFGLDVEVTVPSPIRRFALETVSGNVCSVNVAVTVRAAFMVTMHVAPETLSQPVHPVKLEPVEGVAVSVTTVPTS